MVFLMENTISVDSNKIITDTTAKIVEDAAMGFWSRIKGYFKDINAHDEINMGMAYEEYLKNTYSKNSKIKTLIYRHVPKDLYSFYECVGVSYNNTLIKTDTIRNIIDLCDKVIITGTGGMGKTIMMKHLFLNTSKETSYIPVLVELRAVNVLENDEISICDIIYNNLVNNGFRMERKYFDYSMEEGAYVILFDGYDEVNRDKNQKITNEILSTSGKFPKNKYIISSRPSDEFVGWNDFSEMKCMPLTKEQALNLISKLDFDDTVKEVFSRELEATLYNKYKSFASNPLLLTIMLLTFDSRASIPDRLNDFYEQAFATLFNMHDATKDAYVRDIRSKLGCEDFKLIFAYFCFKSYFATEYEFSEGALHGYLQAARDKFEKINFKIEDFQDDLTQSVCMLVKDGINFRFSHRSFQEYFAAWYTCKLEDKIQYELITKWMKESDSVRMDSYLPMLFILQGEKVNKIILYPGLKQLAKKYQELGFSMHFLRWLFSGVIANSRVIENNKLIYFLSLKIKNKYYCNIFQMTCDLNGFRPSIKENELETKIAKMLIESNIRDISFYRLMKLIDENELMDALKWFKMRMDFCVNFMNKIDKTSRNKKKQVKDILEEL